MKKRLIFTLTCLMSIAAFGQERASRDSVQLLSADTLAAPLQSRIAAERVEGATKAAGDSAYMRNEYNLAIRIYETLLSQGEAAELYYNLGNSYYKSDQIASAILNYERALLLQPGNGDIRVNLEIARSKSLDKVEAVPEFFLFSWTKALIHTLSVDAWGRLAIAFFLLFLVALYLFIFSKSTLLKKIGFVGGVLFLSFTLLANLFANEQKEELINRNAAIVMEPSVTVRSTPSEGGTTLFLLHEGSKVTIKDNSMREWKEIRLEDGKVGWLPAASIEVI